MLEISLPQGVHVSGDSAQICLSFNVFTNNTCAEHCPRQEDRKSCKWNVKMVSHQT